MRREDTKSRNQDRSLYSFDRISTTGAATRLLSTRRSKSSLLSLLLTLAILDPATSFAQLPATVSPETAVSVVTVLPGDPVYTIFGHSAIRFVDPTTGLDVSFNYGTFDFDNTFVFRFASGKLDYRLDVSPTAAGLRQYRFERRTTIEQRLNLDASQTIRLYDLLIDNYRPENRYYRYDFFLDNCSTRIRDILEGATGFRIDFGARADAADPPPETTFRNMLDPYIQGLPVLAALMNVGLGSAADRVASYRERAFLPTELMSQLDATLRPDGASLVSSVDTLFAPPAHGSEGGVRFDLLLMWLLAASLSALTLYRGIGKKPRLRFIDATVFGAAGVVGLLLTYLWFLSEHTVTQNNINLLWALPTNVIAAGYTAKRHLPPWTRVYFAIVVTLAVVLVCGLSWWTQEVPVLVVPIVMLIAFRAGRCLFSATNRPA